MEHTWQGVEKAIADLRAEIVAGVQGMQGEKGDKGDKGDKGAKGDKGVEGRQGPGPSFSDVVAAVREVMQEAQADAAEVPTTPES